MKIKNSLLKGVFALSIGGIVTKLIGVLYRIPLTNLLGAKGIGLYQMVFPLYSILLTFSSTGVPNGIAKLIAEGGEKGQVLKSSVKIFFIISLIFSFLMATFCFKIAKVQGDKGAWLGYLLISPSVVIVSIISCYRGYFQGQINMKPTAVSQVVEQAVKLVFGLIFVYVFRKNVVMAVGGATLAVTISELVALLYLFILAKKDGGGIKINQNYFPYKSIIKVVVPMMAVTLIMPLIRFVDSFLILNVLSKYLENATSLYGIYSGVVESIVSLPIAVLYSLAVTSVPIVSKLKKNGENYTKKILKIVLLTFILGVILGALLCLFSPLIIKILFNNLSENNKLIAVNMLKLSSLSVVFLSTMQTLIASLNACGFFKITIINTIISGFIKIISTLLFLKIPKINIFGAVFSDVLCYLIACFLNLSYIIYKLIKLRRNNYE